MKEMLVSLLMWISAETGIPYKEQALPEVALVSAEALVRIQFNGDLPENYDPRTTAYLGLYDHKRNRIYVLRDLDFDSVYGRSVLVHELVHYLQYSAGLEDKVMCQRQLEELAYVTQETYLMQNNHPVPFSTLDVFYRSLCHFM